VTDQEVAITQPLGLIGEVAVQPAELAGGRRPVPRDIQVADRRAIDEFQQQPEPPLRLVQDGAVVCRRAQPGPRQQFPVGPNLALAPLFRPLLGPHRGAEILEEDLDLVPAVQADVQDLRAV
jgi:hypothetical protein